MKIKPPPVNVPQEVAQWMREAMAQVNALSECQMAATYGAMTAAPTGGTWAEGDFVPNKTPSELGSGGSKYVITGWQYVGGVWLQRRALTGN
jgi:hypothetical protein